MMIAQNFEEVIIRIIQTPLCDIQKRGKGEIKIYLDYQLKNFVQRELREGYTLEMRLAIEGSLNKFLKTVMGEDR